MLTSDPSLCYATLFYTTPHMPLDLSTPRFIPTPCVISLRGRASRSFYPSFLSSSLPLISISSLSRSDPHSDPDFRRWSASQYGLKANRIFINTAATIDASSPDVLIVPAIPSVLNSYTMGDPSRDNASGVRVVEGVYCWKLRKGLRTYDTPPRRFCRPAPG